MMSLSLCHFGMNTSIQWALFIKLNVTGFINKLFITQWIHENPLVGKNVYILSELFKKKKKKNLHITRLTNVNLNRQALSHIIGTSYIWIP